MAYKNYKYEEKEVELEGKKFTAIYPKTHSRIKGIAVHSFNANAWDSWANIADYRTICYVLWKGQKDWKKEYEGKSREFEIKGKEIKPFNGLYQLLFDLETEKSQKEFLREQEIKKLGKRIKSDSKRLEELTKAF